MLKRKEQEIKEIVKEKDFEVKLIKDSYSFLYENSPLIYFVLNPRGRILEFNRQAATFLDISYMDFAGKEIGEIFSTSPSGKFESYIKNVFINRYDSFHINYIDKNNKTHTGTAFLNAVVNKQDEIATVQMAALLSGFDIINESIQKGETEITDINGKIIEKGFTDNDKDSAPEIGSKTIQRADLSSHWECPVLFFAADQKGIISKTCGGIKRILGYEPSDIVGSPLSLILKTGTDKTIDQLFQKEDNEEESVSVVEVFVVSSSGRFDKGKAYCQKQIPHKDEKIYIVIVLLC